jgi:hypothetical protein
MAEQPHTDTSGKSKTPSIISRITNKVSLFDRFSTSTQNPNSVAPGASTTQLRKVSSYPYGKAILAGEYKPCPTAPRRRPRPPAADSQIQNSRTQGTATLAPKGLKGDEKTVLAMKDSTTHNFGPTNALSGLRKSSSPGSVSSPATEPRLTKMKIPPYYLNRDFHIPKSSIAGSLKTENSVVAEHHYPQSSYALYHNAGYQTRHSNGQMQSAGQSRDDKKEPHSTLSNEFEGKEHLRPECQNVPHNSRDDWAANRAVPPRANTGPEDERLKTKGLGTTSSLFLFADQEDKDT